MADKQIYELRQFAEAARRSLKGWPEARVRRLNCHCDKQTGRHTHWYLECAPNQFMREDGFVR